MELIDGREGERGKNIRRKINNAVLSAPSVSKAKRWVKDLSKTSDTIQYASGVCIFDDEERWCTSLQKAFFPQHTPNAWQRPLICN